MNGLGLGMRHLHHARKERVLATDTAGLPSHKGLDRLMLAVGFVQPLALLPQIWKIYVEHSTAGVSLSTWALFTAFNALWALYGAVHKDGPITRAYILITFLDAVIVLGVLIY